MANDKVWDSIETYEHMEDCYLDYIQEPLFVIEEDEIPNLPVHPISKMGDIWLLGSHRVMCGDSTNMQHVAKLTDNKKAVLMHADPPYGMGKEKDGVENDNLYADKLDAFQMLWWQTWRKHLEDNASAYIWGNPENLWRLWWKNGLKDSERLTMRNEIVWAKPSGLGQRAELTRSYAVNTERLLFFMVGEQGFNRNSDNFWDGYEPLRSYLEHEMEKNGWTIKDLNEITGTYMASHWVTKSQWVLPTKEHYEKIQNAARDHDSFKRDHDSFKRDYDSFKRGYDSLKREFYSTRAYFNNTHDNMNEVWLIGRVSGEDRHGHATPKPLEIMQRIIKSSAPEGGLLFEPFGGSGSTLIGAEQTGRICYTMELTPAYVDVIVKRWENLTGKTAEKSVS